jgi:hypothetical protein
MLQVELEVPGVMVSTIVVLAVSEPELPVMVTVAVPTVAVLLAASVSALVAVAGLVANTAVTPLGRPDAARVTDPVNPFRSVTVMVLVALRPSAIEIAGAEGVSEKVGVGLALTVTVMAVLATKLLAVPTMLTVVVPITAELLAVSVRTLEPVVGLVPKDAVTPLGRPDAARVALALKQDSVTVMVSVAVLP